MSASAESSRRVRQKLTSRRGPLTAQSSALPANFNASGLRPKVARFAVVTRRTDMIVLLCASARQSGHRDGPKLGVSLGEVRKAWRNLYEIQPRFLRVGRDSLGHALASITR